LDLSVTKDGPAQAFDGDVVTFTVDVQAAPFTDTITISDTVGISYTVGITDTVVITDTLPGGLDYAIDPGLWGCGIGSPGKPGSYITTTIPLGESEMLVCEGVMADGTNAPLIITGTVNISDPAVITNTVTVAAKGGGSASDSAGLRLNQTDCVDCPDSDNDGVINPWDLCPSTPPCSGVDQHGCRICESGECIKIIKPESGDVITTTLTLAATACPSPAAIKFIIQWPDPFSGATNAVDWTDNNEADGWGVFNIPLTPMVLAPVKIKAQALDTESNLICGSDWITFSFSTL
jgi:hypothetical protein